MTEIRCRNCGDVIRRVQPGDGIDPRDYEWVHVYPMSNGGEIANPICDMTLIAEPGMTDIMAQARQEQIAALIATWREEKAERNDLADSMFTDGNKSYQQGYADALDRCVQALKLLQVP